MRDTGQRVTALSPSAPSEVMGRSHPRLELILIVFLTSDPVSVDKSTGVTAVSTEVAALEEPG